MANSGGRFANLIPDQLLQQLVAGDSKHKARKEHAQRDDDGARKRAAQRPRLQVGALEAHKGGEDDERRGQDVADGEGVDEDALRQPGAQQHRLDLHEGHGRVGAAERERARHEAEHEQVDGRRRAGDAEGERNGRRDAAEDGVDGVACVLQDEERGGGDPETAGNEHVDDAVQAEGDEAVARG